MPTPPTLQLTRRDDELEVTIEASSLEEVFAQAVLAVGEVLSDDGAESTEDRLPVLVRAAGIAQLFADFLADLLELAGYESFAAGRVERLHVDERQVRAALSGRTGAVSVDPGVAVRALDIQRTDGRWRAEFILST
jgi:SHS2 domain-containing protein